MGSDPATEQADHAGESAGKPAEQSADPAAVAVDADAKPDPRPWWRRPDCLGIFAFGLALPLLFLITTWCDAPPASLAQVPRISGDFAGIIGIGNRGISIRVTIAGTPRDFHESIDPAFAIGLTRLPLHAPVTLAADSDNALWSLRDAHGREQLDTDALLASARSRWHWRMVAVPLGFTVVFLPVSLLLMAMQLQPRKPPEKTRSAADAGGQSRKKPDKNQKTDAETTRELQMMVGLISLLALAGCVISLCNIPTWIRDHDLHQVSGTFARIDRLDRVSKDNPDAGDTLTITINTASGALTCTQILPPGQVEPLRTLNAGMPVTATLDDDNGLWAVSSGPYTLLDAAPLISARHAAIITQVIVTALVVVAALVGLRWARQGERDRARAEKQQKNAEKSATIGAATATPEAANANPPTTAVTPEPEPDLHQHQVRYPVTISFWGWENLICISQCIQGWLLIHLALRAVRAADGDYGWNLATWRPLIALTIGTCWGYPLLFVVIITTAVTVMRVAQVIAPKTRGVVWLTFNRRAVLVVLLMMAAQAGLLAWLAVPALHQSAPATVAPGPAWCALIAGACGVVGMLRIFSALRT